MCGLCSLVGYVVSYVELQYSELIELNIFSSGDLQTCNISERTDRIWRTSGTGTVASGSSHQRQDQRSRPRMAWKRGVAGVTSL